MNLVIDWGNTHCKWAVFNNRELVYACVEAGKDLQELGKYNKTHAGIEFALLASVVNINESVKTFLRINFTLLELTVNSKLPVKNLYKTPETLGNDRLASAVGAQALFPGKDVLVIDAGTCIKFDLVNAHAEYLGGSIAPGITMRFKALHQFTDRLPLVAPAMEVALTGGSTQESILSGVLNGCVAEVDGMIGLYKEQYPNLTVVLTGGDSIYFDKKLKNSIFAAPQLVLEGLNEILRHNV